MTKLCCLLSPFYSCTSCGIRECRTCLWTKWKMHNSGVTAGCPITGKRLKVERGEEISGERTLHFYEP